ncbi:MAG TPA: hypothetical protein VIJ75_09230 [Hanamia sp.]
MQTLHSKLPNIGFTHNLFNVDHLSTNFDKLNTVISAPEKLAAGIKLASVDAAKFGIDLSKDDANSLMTAYNAVVKDGRYIKQFESDPKGAAKKLNLNISDSAAKAVQTAVKFNGVRQLGGGAAADTVDVICVAVIVVLCAKPTFGDQQVIIDQSGMLKV